MLALTDVYPSTASTGDTLHVSMPIRAADGVEIDSLRLLQGQREICIRHGSEVYRLRHTRNDKLILTK